MTTKTLRPWTHFINLHPDLQGVLTESLFAIDLGAVYADDKNVSKIYRDPDAFFRATHLTQELTELLNEVLASLGGATSFNRVLKLRTPFGGGKSHTLTALLHAARNFKSLQAVAPITHFADPGPVRVAVFDGEKFDVKTPKIATDGTPIHTMWGWIAKQLGDDAYSLVKSHDEAKVSPGGDIIKKMLGTQPCLILLDEVLKYMERAAAVSIHDSTLQRQAKDFFQSLTIEVPNTTNAVLVYSLQWSGRESLGNVALLEEVDKLANRVDQVREPVTGDEILPILQKRLLSGQPPTEVAREVADAYASIVSNMRRAYADNPSRKQEAEEFGVLLSGRIQKAYPFHPALIDIMKERWSSIEDFQRTRGALRFLAASLFAVKSEGPERPLLGPGDIPIGNIDVRLKLLKELGLQNRYDHVITSDLEGPNARAKRIDEQIARDNPSAGSAKPATKLATAILVYSFGGLHKEGNGETLPAGVTEAELLEACVGPDLDNFTARSVLSELRNQCLYLHFDGVRYCFKTEANVTKLIEDAEQQVSRTPNDVREKIREILYQRLAGQHSAVIWPPSSSDIDDKQPLFLVAYLPLEFANISQQEQQKTANDLLFKFGERPRAYRNAIALAIPDKKQIEALRRAVRYLLAIQKVEEKKTEHRLTKDQLEQLKERRRTEDAAAESALRNMYTAVWLPRLNGENLEIEVIDSSGRPLQAINVHERIMELLTTTGVPKVHGTLAARKIIDRLKLGESLSPDNPNKLGVRLKDIVDSFFSTIEPPRLISLQPLNRAVIEGVEKSLFAFTTVTNPTLVDGRFEIPKEKVFFGATLSEDEIDIDNGFIFLPSSMPKEPEQTPGAHSNTGQIYTAPTTSTKSSSHNPATPQLQQTLEISFKANREQLFKAFYPMANLADASDGSLVTVTVSANKSAGYDPVWLRNAVEEPLDEAEIHLE